MSWILLRGLREAYTAHELRNEVVEELSLGLMGESGIEREAALPRGGGNRGIQRLGLLPMTLIVALS